MARPSGILTQTNRRASDHKAQTRLNRMSQPRMLNQIDGGCSAEGSLPGRSMTPGSTGGRTGGDSGPRIGSSSGVDGGSSCGCGGASGSRTGVGISGRGLPGGLSCGGSCGFPGLAGGTSCGSRLGGCAITPHSLGSGSPYRGRFDTVPRRPPHSFRCRRITVRRCRCSRNEVQCRLIKRSNIDRRYGIHHSGKGVKQDSLRR